MNIFVPSIYRNQHLVLQTICYVPSVNEFLNIKQISNSTGLTEEEVMQAAYLLMGSDFAHVQRNEKPFRVVCSPKGAEALFQRRLLEEGKERGKANFLRWIQIAGIVIASLIGIMTFISNTIKTNSNSIRIQKAESDIIFLKNRISNHD